MSCVIRTDEINGFYGGSHTPCKIWKARMSDDSTWYMVENSNIAFQTLEEVSEGVNIEELHDLDVFTVMENVKSIEHFEELVEE